VSNYLRPTNIDIRAAPVPSRTLISES